jgi:hypothetical protein
VIVCQWFGLKTTGTVSPGLASKSVVTVSPGLVSKLVALDFPVLASKSVALVWSFGPQNHRNGFLVCASKSGGRRFISCATKSTKGGQRETRIKI